MFMNSNLFEPGKSKSERTFVQSAVKQNIRFDGRKSNEFRDVKLTFGADWGTVALSMGDTKVLAQVSCDIGTPSSARGNEGTLHLNVDIKGVAFLDEVQATHDQRQLTLNSLLERTFRSSRCLDLESLCIATEQHVWCVRVDINVLNHDGNLYDASTIAALAALMHFRRPDVSFIEDEIRTYSERERELMPLLFLHYPVSVTYCVYKSSTQPLVDPTLLEENAADSIIVLSFNSYQELCTLNAGGTAPTNVRTIMQCAHGAARRSKALVQFIRKALELDAERREQPMQVFGLMDLLNETAPKLSFKYLMEEEAEVDHTPDRARVIEQKSDVEPMQLEEPVPQAQMQTPKKILAETTEDDIAWLPQEQPVDEATPTAAKPGKAKPNRAKNKGGKKQQSQTTKKQNDSDSEEEVTQIL
ncbi:exosome complex component rrp45 [Drosophila grimshawi]|uniref:Exosome complex component RRP45 n=1 Tax=Drosophila grimshawi TaxID=7222 RepID=B4IXZ8_DROGR|nr:exosome complex component rrp45 [Drosophila grimshawi]EDV97541.1 GH14641 [Drosophila grimshawi]